MYLLEWKRLEKKFSKAKKKKKWLAFQLLMHIVRAEKNNVNIFFLQLSLIWHAIIISGSVSKWLETLLSAIFPKIWQFYKLFYRCTWNQPKMGVTIIFNFYYRGGFIGVCVELPKWPSTYCDYEFEGSKDLSNFRNKDAWSSTIRD